MLLLITIILFEDFVTNLKQYIKELNIKQIPPKTQLSQVLTLTKYSIHIAIDYQQKQFAKNKQKKNTNL